jgi:type VI secretion system ImpM family protein
MTIQGPIGLFGKIPAQADFYRQNVADPAAQALVAWLQDAVEPVYRARLDLPGAPVRFLFRVPEAPNALVGVLAAGVDKVGRSFPLCAFVPVAARDLAATYPALPAAARPFGDAAAALLAEAKGLDGAGLAARARDLPLPSARDLAAAEDASRRDAGAARVADLVARLFGDLPAGAAAYALGTFEAAVKPVRGREPSRAQVALDCPAGNDVDRWAWLDLARRALGWAVPPPFFWTDGAPGRLLVSLGGPPSGLLAHLCDPARPGSKIWPLRTAQAGAIETARRTLTPAALRALDAADASVEALVAAAANR